MSEREVNGFSACFLFYGDHPELARRCLGSILTRRDENLVTTLRVGLNAVSPATRDIVHGLLSDYGVHAWIYDSPVNRFKYPMMRKMFYDAQHPIVTQYLMWFDDDSCLAPETTSEWWQGVHQALQQTDMLGSIWQLPLTGRQALGIEAQAWYTGKSVRGAYKARFATGGWWAARTRLIQKWDYPFPELRHNGGDVMLGELWRQQGLRITPFTNGLWINADDTGKCSSAARRGASQAPLWYKFDPKLPMDCSQHAFVLSATAPVRPVPAAPAAPARPVQKYKRIPGL